MPAMRAKLGGAYHDRGFNDASECLLVFLEAVFDADPSLAQRLDVRHRETYRDSANQERRLGDVGDNAVQHLVTCTVDEFGKPLTGRVVRLNWVDVQTTLTWSRTSELLAFHILNRTASTQRLQWCDSMLINEQSYALEGVIVGVHGHYVYFYKGEAGWVRIDNHKVTLVRALLVQSESERYGYVFVYQQEQ